MELSQVSTDERVLSWIDRTKVKVSEEDVTDEDLKDEGEDRGGTRSNETMRMICRG